MSKLRKCFIMLCTNTTKQECLQRRLFGDREWRLPYLKEIKKDDIGFLFNIQGDVLIGIFKAQTEPQLNIEPDAWRGAFPTQVRVEPIGEIQEIPNALSIFKKIGLKLKPLPSGKLVPQFSVHAPEVTEKILAHFKVTLPISEEREISEIKPSPKLKFDDVIGLHHIKEFIKKRIIDVVAEEKEAQKYYLRLSCGLLLYGPPGTGKTLLAQATAGEIDAQFVELTPSIIRGYPGEPEKKIEELFQNLYEAPRAVLFIDEAEALLAANPESTVMKRIISVLLSQLAKLSRVRFKPIFIIAATNKPWEIDEAFRRPGRIDKAFYVNLPNESERKDLLCFFLKKRNHDCVNPKLYEDECLSTLAKQLEGYSGADIERIIDEVALDAFHQHTYLTCEMFKEKIKIWPRSVNREQLEQYEEWSRSIGNIA